MPYYKTPLPGPITILCAGRIEGAWGVFGQEPTGRGGLRVDQADLRRAKAKHPDGRRKLTYELSFLVFYWQPPTGLNS